MLFPNEEIRLLTDIDPDFMKKRGLTAVLLDIDNTMALHDCPEPYEGVADWCRMMTGKGYKLIIVSNNSNPARISAFAGKLGLAYITKAEKPLPTGFRRAMKALGVSPEETVVVGDQIFTDILGGAAAGTYTVLVPPLGEYETRFIKFKRLLEKPVLAAYRRKRRA